MSEITACKDLLIGKSIIIHPHAAVVTQQHRDTEARNVKIGSTMKGTGAAVIHRIVRDPDSNPIARDNISMEWLDRVAQLGVFVAVRADLYDASIASAKLIQIEGAQGYSLSIYHGFYPYTTSRDITPSQVMADTAMPYRVAPEIIGTLRTMPIRVANRFDAEGKMIGTSGPCYHDQIELDWNIIRIKPELTTVTKLPRRIFSFSMEQTREACWRCSPASLFLNFANYFDKEEIDDLVARIHEVSGGALVKWIGVGPTHQDVIVQHQMMG